MVQYTCIAHTCEQREKAVIFHVGAQINLSLVFLNRALIVAFAAV